MVEERNITTIILAGGKSTRMKEDKGLIHFNGKMLVEVVIDAVKKITTNIIIITSTPAYKQFGCTCIEDEIKEKGPLGGILTGLANSSTKKNLVVGCDMPFLSHTLHFSLFLSFSHPHILVITSLHFTSPLLNPLISSFRPVRMS